MACPIRRPTSNHITLIHVRLSAFSQGANCRPLPLLTSYILLVRMLTSARMRSALPWRTRLRCRPCGYTKEREHHDTH